MRVRADIVAMAMLTLVSASKAVAASQTFVKFGDLAGSVTTLRHSGWSAAASWTPVMPAGETCKSGTINCLNTNGHRLVIKLERDQLNEPLEKALVAGAIFNQVVIDDFNGGETGDYSLISLSLSGARIERGPTGNDNQVILTFEKSSMIASVEEGEILGIRRPNR
jgi:hypothetical protein